MAFVMVVLCGAAGSLLLGRLRENLNSLELMATGGAIGLGAFAMSIFVVGMLGVYNVGLPIATALFGILGLIGLRYWRFKPSFDPLCVAVVFFLCMALCYVSLPPDGNDWDGLAYHLAVPKLYLLEGRIHNIAFTHHSNFPFLWEMLYTWGLWANGATAAKLFHWAALSYLCIGVAGFAQRLGANRPWLGSLILASSPIVFWESTVAYADLATALYVFLAVLAIHRGIVETERKLILLAGVLMGFALGTKYLALVSVAILGLTALGTLLVRRQVQMIPTLLLSGLLAVLIGCPWYIKTYLYTSNPVYPFAYSLFGGRNWSEENAAAYRGDQLKFGMGRSVDRLIMAPNNMVSFPEKFMDPVGLIVGERAYTVASSGPAMAAAPFVSSTAGLPLGFVIASFLAWFGLMQQTRYLIPIFPILSATAAVAQGRLRKRALWLVVALQSIAALWIFGGALLPWTSAIWNREKREEYLTRRFQPYEAYRFINEQTAPSAKIGLYDEPRGFYLERQYLWANAGHHMLIPYSNFSTSSDLVEGLKSKGITHILINRRFWPQESIESWRIQLEQAIAVQEIRLLFDARGVEVYEL